MAGVLLVGTDRERIAELRAMMRDDGHVVQWHKNFDDWRAAEREMAPDVVVAPVESCDPVLGAAGRAPRGFPAPLLLIQAYFRRYCSTTFRLVLAVKSRYLCSSETWRIRVSPFVILIPTMKPDAPGSFNSFRNGN